MGAQDKHRKGRPSPVELAEKAGYRIVRSKKDLATVKPGQTVWAFAEALTGGAALPYEMDRPADQPSLADYVRAGITVLDGEKGFFMMVEGGKIDWACHAHDAAAAIGDTLAFDRAVEVALEFGRKHPDETLIVVTADHETGGMAIGQSATKYSYKPARMKQVRSNEAFARQVVEWKKAKVDYADALPVLQEAFGLDEPTPDELTELRRAYDATMSGKRDTLTRTASELVDRRVGIGWTSTAHTGIPVPTSAWGAGAQRFQGMYDNTDIFRRILAAMQLPGVQVLDPNQVMQGVGH